MPVVQTFPVAPGVELGGGGSLPVIAGPCVIEGEDWLVAHAQTLRALAIRLSLPLVFKASFDKANRSSLDSFRGPGLEDGLHALAAVKRATGLSLLTDVHEPNQCEPAAAVCDMLQIPAFLCRQTDLLVAAARTGRVVMIKKGQFVAPEDMLRAVEKVRAQGNERVGVIERGTSFGYHNLIVDMRSFTVLHEDGIPVLYDATHSLQLPGARGHESGGDRRFAEPLARAAIAAGADGLYLEVHPDPASAKSDRETQLSIGQAEALLASVLTVHHALAVAGPVGEESRGR
ncbi:MAG TPA: 3-deoxy-8-phosphooctulonate synthase [Thermoanaerobaculia bacterium]|nr:3-deoxy-8-phosphooctulonate synthase [Thermoanaerobaculia bacterium]